MVSNIAIYYSHTLLCVYSWMVTDIAIYYVNTVNYFLVLLYILCIYLNGCQYCYILCAYSWMVLNNAI